MEPAVIRLTRGQALRRGAAGVAALYSFDKLALGRR
jgi:hypothetical protein